MIGTITGRQISKNRDGDKDVLILQVELIDGEDTRSIELFTDSDFNPANGTRICITDVSSSYQIGTCVSDGLTPEVEAGEKEIYSTDNPVTQKKARMYLNKDGEIILNQGAKSAINHPDTVTALNTFLIALNSQLVSLGGLGYGGLTIDLSGAEVPEVLL